MKIGFIGLGIMGRPMALNLHAAQHSLLVYDRASLTRRHSRRGRGGDRTARRSPRSPRW